MKNFQLVSTFTRSVYHQFSSAVFGRTLALIVTILFCLIATTVNSYASQGDGDHLHDHQHDHLHEPTTSSASMPTAPMILQPPPANVKDNSTYYGSRVASNAIANPVLDMKALVLHEPGDTDGIQNMIEGYLEILGVPFTSIDTTSTTIDASTMWDGANHGYYYAVFITTSDVWYNLTAAERSVIATYELDFNVRQATLYVLPNAADYGLDLDEANPNPSFPLNTTFTAAGQSIFSYLKPSLNLSLEGPFIYGYTATPASGANYTPWLTDSTGKIMAGMYTQPDGREQASVMVSSFFPALSPAYIHARLLPYGLIHWATRGMFIGERHHYFTPQPDDVLTWGDAWDPVNHETITDFGYRNSANDITNLVAWQNDFRANTPNAAGLKIEMPFNGQGSLADLTASGQIVSGTLTAAVVANQSEFVWLNHTYDHTNLNTTDYTTNFNQIADNDGIASTLGFADYSESTLLTGEYSGINPPNSDLTTAAFDNGIEYMLVNASVAGFGNPSPNTGIPHPQNNAILQLPRYANNIFYSVTTPEQETDLYNWIYCDGYQSNPTVANRCYDYAFVQNSVTDQALDFMLEYSVNANMFHMNNFGDYGNGDTLMTDFIEQIYGKYNQYFNTNVPIVSLRTQEIGRKMQDRAAFNSSGVTGQLSCGDQITLSTTNAATVPVTGVIFGSQTENYAGDDISYIPMGANGSVVIPGAAASVASAPSNFTMTAVNQDIQLSWSPVTQDSNGNSINVLEYRIYARANSISWTPTPADLLAATSGTAFTHVGGASGGFTYLVVAVSDNCWQLESAESNRLTLIPTAALFSRVSAETASTTSLLVPFSVFIAALITSLWAWQTSRRNNQ